MSVLPLAVLLVLLAVSTAGRRGWPPAVRATAAWERARPYAAAYVKASPGTFAYLVVITVTTWVLLGSSNQVVDLLLLEHSTNLHQLRINPVRVLVRSAFWAPGYSFLAWVVLFALVLAPAERWLGTRRWAVVFGAGHVLATLGSVSALALAIRYGWAPQRLENSVDVGVSYGFAAVAAVFTFRLPRRWRPAWATALVLAAVTALLVSRTFTDAGHLMALGVGFAAYPLTRDALTRARTAEPIWAPTRSAP